jgi:hypothetical protein
MMARTPANVAMHATSDVGTEVVDATVGGASTVADGSTEKCCEDSLEAAVERALSDLAAEGRGGRLTPRGS